MSRPFDKKDAAERYDSARELPPETGTLWMDNLEKLVPVGNFTRILDLGGGTGRFSGLLQNTYGCSVITIDPSEAMLIQGKKHGLEYGVCGAAEHIPVRTGSVDMVFMSQVFHHLEDLQIAFNEVYRVLKPPGYFVIRNATRENNRGIDWRKCFPEAREIEDKIIPSQADIIGSVSRQWFDFITFLTVYQLFAYSYTEYFEKISQRVLSPLISISDEAFDAGLARFREWITEQPEGQPAYEPLDMFVFRKRV